MWVGRGIPVIHVIFGVLHFLIAWLFGLPLLLITIPLHLLYAACSRRDRSPDAPAPKLSWVGRRKYHDIACASFFFIGLLALWTSFLIHTGGDPAAAVGMGVIGPFGIPLAVALVLGPGLSLLLWRNELLLILAVITIVVFAELGGRGFERWPAILLPLAAIVIAANLVWWLGRRKTWR
jgi:hypothetical protein